jgi:hypothetical protein
LCGCKFALEEALKTERGSRGIALLLEFDGVGGQSHAPAALPQGQEIRHPLYKRLGEHQVRSGRVRRNLARTETRSPNHPARSESRGQLSYPGPICKTEKKNLKAQKICRLHHSFKWSNLFRVTIIRNIQRNIAGKIQNIFTPTDTL